MDVAKFGGDCGIFIYYGSTLARIKNQSTNGTYHRPLGATYNRSTCYTSSSMLPCQRSCCSRGFFWKNELTRSILGSCIPQRVGTRTPHISNAANIKLPAGSWHHLITLFLFSISFWGPYTATNRPWVQVPPSLRRTPRKFKALLEAWSSCFPNLPAASEKPAPRVRGIYGTLPILP